VGITTETVMTIVCDNEKCPGNELDPHVLAGWIQIQTQVHPVPPPPPTIEVNPLIAGDAPPLPPPLPAMTPTNNHVFCSTKCASAALRTYQIENPV
jgi:hypothetical protein